MLAVICQSNMPGIKTWSCLNLHYIFLLTIWQTQVKSSYFSLSVLANIYYLNIEVNYPAYLALTLNLTLVRKYWQQQILKLSPWWPSVYYQKIERYIKMRTWWICQILKYILSMKMESICLFFGKSYVEQRYSNQCQWCWKDENLISTVQLSSTPSYTPKLIFGRLSF